MSFIATKQFAWTASPSPDTTHHRVRVCPVAEPLSYTTAFEEVASPISAYTLQGAFDITGGDYRVGVSARDAAMNESDIAEMTYTFDFSPPSPPSALSIS